MSLIAAMSAALGSLASCYPDFQFTPEPSGASSSSTGTGRPGTSATSGVGGAHPTGSSTSAAGTSSSKSASSSSGMSGPPCDVSTEACAFAESCCFDETVPPTDLCATSCPSGHLPLRCASDADCASGKKCCALFDTFTLAVKGTSCRADCSASDALPGCDPTASPPCSCHQLLGSYFSNDTATAPYDRYGYCN